MKTEVKQICTNCILDSEISDILFNDDGVCNYCLTYREQAGKELLNTVPREFELNRIVDAMKKKGRGKNYDCIIGLSGGVDSSYVALLTKRLGLRALAVHLDNGWNSEISVKNIKNIVEKLGLDLHTHVIDWEEFKDLQVAFLKAGVVDIELLTDHAISAIMYHMARKEKVDYFISGYNLVTEGIMPANWSYAKWDRKNILAIHSLFGQKELKTYPTYSLITKILGEFKYKTFRLLNYVEYNKQKVIEELIDELGWQSYGGKHHESIFTKFYQSYILPKKFGIDKRKAHISNLICSSQMTREQGLEEILKPIYNSMDECESEIEYVVKKLGLKRSDFDKYMSEPAVSHLYYPNGQRMNNFLKSIKRIVVAKQGND
ncbi:MAG: hypothetical protein AMXMBFR48_13140 [Ignavibacteriales bacterium]